MLLRRVGDGLGNGPKPGPSSIHQAYHISVAFIATSNISIHYGRLFSSPPPQGSVLIPRSARIQQPSYGWNRKCHPSISVSRTRVIVKASESSADIHHQRNQNGLDYRKVSDQTQPKSKMEQQHFVVMRTMLARVYDMIKRLFMKPTLWILFILSILFRVRLRKALATISLHDVSAHVAPAATSLLEQQGNLALFCVLFVVGATLAAAETAITTMWPWKVRELSAQEGTTSVFASLEKDVTRYLTTILIATTLCTILSTSLATEVATAALGANAIAYVTVFLTVIFLFFGEILPKSLAVHNSQMVARATLPIIHTLSIFLYPIGKLLATMSSFLLRIFRLPTDSAVGVSEQELRLIVAGANASGSIETFESKLITNVLDLNETEIREVMCPRVDMVALDENTTLREFLNVEKDSRFSRMPVYRDGIDNISGIVYAKTLLKYLDRSATVATKPANANSASKQGWDEDDDYSFYSAEDIGDSDATSEALASIPASSSKVPPRSILSIKANNNNSKSSQASSSQQKKQPVGRSRSLSAQQAYLDEVTVKDLAEPAFFVPESMSSWVALEEMRRRRLHMAIVVDEYGGTAGLVTLEDILEELVGEIYDEDDILDSQEQDIKQEATNKYTVAGQADLEAVVVTLGMDIEDEDLHDYGTISGLLCDKMGEIPEIGDSLILSNICFTVLSTDERRILQLSAEVLTDERRVELLKKPEETKKQEQKKNAINNGSGLAMAAAAAAAAAATSSVNTGTTDDNGTFAEEDPENEEDDVGGAEDGEYDPYEYERAL